jgi:hypothetical protein
MIRLGVGSLQFEIYSSAQRSREASVAEMTENSLWTMECTGQPHEPM